MRHYPVVFKWVQVDLLPDENGVVERRLAMVPLKRYGNLAASQFHESEDYPLVVLEARSRASHDHFFASVGEGFENLPENLDVVGKRLNIRFPPGGFVDVEHFRKWLLCKTGWCESVDEFNFETQAAAIRAATQLARWTKREKTYCSISVVGENVIMKTPASQSAANMSKEPFEKSKRDVLDLIASILDVSRTELAKNSGRAA